MDNKMAVFNNREFGSIRVIEQNGKYLFCGSDVAKALGYSNPRKAVRDHTRGGTKCSIPTTSGDQTMAFIPEGDVYRLIVHSRMPGAERFEKWVFDEVLPMIRKTGGYMTASLLEQAAEKPEILLAFADQLLAEHEKNRQLSGEVERLRPKADFYDAFVHEENCTNIRATAKELQIGERAFCRFLMDAGFLYRCPAGYLLPYAKPSNDGLFRVKDFWKYGHFGQQTLITPQGKNVIRLLLDDGQMRLEWKERMGWDKDMEQEKLYVIEEKTYEAHIDEEVHLYGLLHQLAFLAGKIKDREDVEAFIAAAKRYGQIADDKFDAWNIPGRYLVFGDKADLAGMKARELCELDAFYVECEDDEPEPGSGRQEEHYLIPGSGFRLLVSELHMFLVTWYSIAKCLSQAQNEKDFLRLQKKYGNYEKTLNRLRRKLGLSADSNFCQDELEAAVIKRFRAELIPGEQISHE